MMREEHRGLGLVGELHQRVHAEHLRLVAVRGVHGVGGRGRRGFVDQGRPMLLRADQLDIWRTPWNHVRLQRTGWHRAAHRDGPRGDRAVTGAVGRLGTGLLWPTRGRGTRRDGAQATSQRRRLALAHDALLLDRPRQLGALLLPTARQGNQLLRELRVQLPHVGGPLAWACGTALGAGCTHLGDLSRRLLAPGLNGLCKLLPMLLGGLQDVGDLAREPGGQSLDARLALRAGALDPLAVLLHPGRGEAAEAGTG
mmetsp:Transcript_730/g.2344  ORF Transcript_730/g.2344 Transcript_730/m.2344 type:complete len:255 (+) Transcript_730:197-961(+)